MSDKLKKLTPHKDGARRRMIMKGLTSVAILPGGRGANPEANVTFFKTADKQDGGGSRRRRRRRGDKDYAKQTGESFEQFFKRVQENEPDITREDARELFDGTAEKGGDLVELATSADDGHQHGIHVYMDGDDVMIIVNYAMGEGAERSHDHQLMRNEDGSYSVLENAGHTHDDISVDSIMGLITRRLLEKEAAGEKMPEEGPLADLLAAAKESEEQPPEGDPKMADNKELDALKAQVATLTAVAALTGAHKTHYDSLDDDGKSDFLKLDNDAKDEAIKAAEAQKDAADPVVYTAKNGDVFKQSDDPRLVAMAKERDAEREENIRLQKQAKDDALTKRAETELANLPGDIEVRKALLESAESIKDEETRKGAVAALKAQNARLGAAFTTVGAGGQPVEKTGDSNESIQELDRLAKERAAKEGENYYTAYEKVAEANPELYAKAVTG